MSDLNDLVRLIETMQIAAKDIEQEEWKTYQADDTKFGIWFAQQQRLRTLTDVLIEAYKFQRRVILRLKEPTDAA